jgi:hypothetical protein
MIANPIDLISVLSIKGAGLTVSTVNEAIVFLRNYSKDKKQRLMKYEIIIRYNTGDRIVALFKNNKHGIAFLKTLIPENPL